MEEPNILNIPAYQRKRSISARARKKPMRQAPRSRIYGANKPAITRKRKTVKKDQLFHEIPITQTLPSEELFPDPLIEDIFPEENTGIREMEMCGICEGYFDKINVAIIRVIKPIRQGDLIIFERENGLFEQKVTSMQINRKDVSLARTGSDIGLKVALKPKVGAPVYKTI